jgi:molybdate/tungstate transport system substrate-binding protein
MSRSRILALFGVCVFAAASCGTHDAAPPADGTLGDIVVFHAASLGGPLREIIRAFEAEHPGARVQLEGSGSRTAARKITELGRRCDVFISADFVVIDDLLIPEHADWSLRFLGNELCIAYHGDSAFIPEAASGDWLGVLARDDVRVARCDPDSAPCGYRAIHTLKLAERYYKKPGSVEKILTKDERYLRPNESDLLGLMEMGAVDYAIMYRSTAERHGYRVIELPPEVNLSELALADRYRDVSTAISGAAPGETVEQVGSPILYGLTIPAATPNPEAAMVFVKFLLRSEAARSIFEEAFLPLLPPLPAKGYENIPLDLQQQGLPQQEHGLSES